MGSSEPDPKAQRPSVSVIIPTLNSAAVLEACMRSIREQDYPPELVEIIVADGGSHDGTVEIARRYGAQVYENPLRTGEAGKAVGVRHASGELLAFIDSDNELPQSDWLIRMVEPFADDSIVAAEPLSYTYRPTDGYITRYCALLGMNDPICLFLGNYDRYSLVTRDWTGLRVSSQDCGGYLKVSLSSERLPTIGANGFIVRRETLVRHPVGDFLFDIDMVARLVQDGFDTFAKVKVGIVHIYCQDLAGFIRKQRRRIRDYLFYERHQMRAYPWRGHTRVGILRFILACGTVLPLLWQAAVGFRRQPDVAWLFHPVACLTTLAVYGVGWIQGRLAPAIEDRNAW